VGADNYGIFATKGREAYRSTHPTDPPDEPISDFLFDRAHNEPLQVLIELGIVGLALFAAPLAVFLWVAARAVIARKRRLSLFFWGACGGMLAFAASSMLSSFSFRIVQNGAAFIIVFAFAVYELSKAHKRTIGSGRIRRVYKAIATLVLATLIAVLSFKAFAEYEFAKGDQMPDRAAAAERYRRALRMDPDYVAADYRLSRVAYDLGDSEAAAAEMRRAIDEGMGVVLTYSNLADCYEAARDQESEFRTFDEALRVYPRSVFLRIRYSIELEKASLHDASRDQLAIAGEIDSKQANGWHELLTLGSTRAFYDARENHAIAAPADLLPQVAVYQYLDKGPWK
jgi:tetratricopeptide (TPR) repeat protein